MAGAVVNHFLGSFASDTAAEVHIAGTGWTPIGGQLCTTPAPGLAYYNTQTLRARTYIGNGVWQEESRFLPPVIAAADDTTPSVQRCKVLLLPANNAATKILDLDDAVEGEIYVLVVLTNTNTPTIEDGGNFVLSAAWAPGATDTLTLLYDGHRFVELFRSNN